MARFPALAFVVALASSAVMMTISSAAPSRFGGKALVSWAVIFQQVQGKRTCAGPRLEGRCRLLRTTCMGSRNDKQICAGLWAACRTCMSDFRQCEADQKNQCDFCIFNINDCGEAFDLGHLDKDGNWED
jgi:hypothetical protein